MATASDGNMGVMQVMSDTVVWLTQSVLRTAIDPLRPTDNIRAGVALLRYHCGPSLWIMCCVELAPHPSLERTLC